MVRVESGCTFLAATWLYRYGHHSFRGLHVVGVLDWSFGMNEYFEITGKNEELF